MSSAAQRSSPTRRHGVPQRQRAHDAKRALLITELLVELMCADKNSRDLWPVMFTKELRVRLRSGLHIGVLLHASSAQHVAQLDAYVARAATRKVARSDAQVQRPGRRFALCGGSARLYGQCRLVWPAGSAARCAGQAARGAFDCPRLPAASAADATAAQLICLDSSGHGKSDNKSLMDSRRDADKQRGATAYSFTDYLYETVETLDVLNVGRFTIIGHSMGGGCGFLLAAALPTRVERLIVIDTFGAMSANDAGAVDELRAAVDFEAAPSRPFDSLRDAAAHRAKKNFVGSMDVDDALLLAERGTTQTSDGRFVWSYDPYLKRTSPVRFSEQQLTHLFAVLDMPVLVLWTKDGLYSRLASPIGFLLARLGFLSAILCFLIGLLVRCGVLSAPLLRGAQFADRLRLFLGHRRFTVTQMPEGGHHVHISRPKEVHMQIEKFLSA